MRTATPAPLPTPPRPSAPSQHRSLVVLPFADADGDPERSYVAEGASDELRNALASIPALLVIARSSSTWFVAGRGVSDDAGAVARDLAVEMALVGRVARTPAEAGKAGDGEHVTVEATLIEARNGAVLWRGTREAAWEEFFPAMGTMAEEVAQALAVTLPRDLLPSTRPSRSAEAHQLLLQGRYHMEQRPIGVKLAMQCFDRAMRLDPELAEAYGGLAILWANFGIFLAVEPATALEKSRGYALRALSIDADEPYALATVMNNLTFYEWDFDGAERIGARLLARHPSLPLPYQVLLYARAARGDVAGVHALGAAVQRIDPRSMDAGSDHAYALHLQGDSAGAVRILEGQLLLHPEASEVHRRLGLALLALGDARRAVTHLERSVALSRRLVWGVANLACARAGAGDVPGARALLAELEERADGELVPAIALAFVHTALGDVDAAFRALGRSVQARDYWLLALAREPLLAALRDDPRFPPLLARVVHA